MAASLFWFFFVHNAHRNSGRCFSWKLHYPRGNVLYTKNYSYFQSGVSPNGNKSEKLLRQSFLSWTTDNKQLTKKIHSYKCKRWNLINWNKVFLFPGLDFLTVLILLFVKQISRRITNCRLYTALKQIQLPHISQFLNSAQNLEVGSL